MRQKYPFSAPWQVNSILISVNCLIYAVTVFNVFQLFAYAVTVFFELFSLCGLSFFFARLIQHENSVAGYGAALSKPDCWKFKAILSCSCH